MFRCLWTLMVFHGVCVQSLLPLVIPEGINDKSCVKICSSNIYCQGELLDDIQSCRLFGDSKTFVDMKLKKNETDILEAYAVLKSQTGTPVPRNKMLDFIASNFEECKLLEWIPSDFKENPLIVDTVQDSSYKSFVKSVNQLWKTLAKKVSDDVYKNPELYSAIYLPNGFFIAGDRFNEIYYWDSYWIIKGALICGMQDTVKGIIENFIYMVQKYGCVLNGGRIYYSGRSQPPFLLQMVDAYYKFTHDSNFVLDNLECLEQEVKFWLTKRCITVEKDGQYYTLARYNTRTCGPRPESYYEDKNLAQPLNTLLDKNDLYARIKSAAESGMDFSTKHFNNNGSNTGTLINTDPQNFFYVELNSILQSNCEILSKFFFMKGDQLKADKYNLYGTRFQRGIDNLLWNEEEGIWLDYDITTKKSRNYFYGTNFVPLFTGSYLKDKSDYYGDRAIQYLIKNKIINDNLKLNCVFCVPTSLYESSQQWDYPNCWPPLQSMLIFGLDSTTSEKAKMCAFNLADAWIKTNYAGFQKTGYMFEKYSAISFGTSGDGGEYKPQKGFGWTNGVVFEIFNRWGNELKC
ncbi:Six-hairpin glycosidase-like,Glycoside hydrolase, family 37 [Cinara cedri]|uniref:Trehalase n=1 Tax=Cinara cedri TaxID=506608 RepID=A0A5E4MNZ7_9HEMI|nr:Six-hairpin glycosidase-like,Glycoside hydrolase, family 37 [Cinara cedri]